MDIIQMDIFNISYFISFIIITRSSEDLLIFKFMVYLVYRLLGVIDNFLSRKDH